MLVCGVCKGKKVIKDSSGKNILCPKCQGKGNIDENYSQVDNKERKVLNG